MAAGDLLFVRAQPRRAGDRLIAWWMKRGGNPPFVHVEIDLGDGSSVGAHWHGVCIRPCARTGEKEEDLVRWSYRAHAQEVDETRLAAALSWARAMVGARYGATDFLEAAFGWLPFYLTWKRRYDCSALAAAFLVRAGGLPLGPFEDDPHLATPGALAKQLGVRYWSPVMEGEPPAGWAPLDW